MVLVGVAGGTGCVESCRFGLLPTRQALILDGHSSCRNACQALFAAPGAKCRGAGFGKREELSLCLERQFGRNQADVANQANQAFCRDRVRRDCTRHH